MKNLLQVTNERWKGITWEGGGSGECGLWRAEVVEGVEGGGCGRWIQCRVEAVENATEAVEGGDYRERR